MSKGEDEFLLQAKLSDSTRLEIVSLMPNRHRREKLQPHSRRPAFVLVLLQERQRHPFFGFRAGTSPVERERPSSALSVTAAVPTGSHPAKAGHRQCRQHPDKKADNKTHTFSPS